MGKVLEFIDISVEDTTLCTLITKAMQLGSIRIWQHTTLDDQPKEDWEVKIIFHSKGKSKIEAFSREKTLQHALEVAIQEALSLGAKPCQR